MSAEEDYYRVLHVAPDAPLAIIRSSYRTIMQRLKMHPDLGGNHDQAALINKAYSVLSKAENRSAYDRRRQSLWPWPRSQKLLASTGTSQDRCIFCGTSWEKAGELELTDSCLECASPLYPARHYQLEDSDNRLLQRIRKQQRVALFTHWPQSEHISAAMRDLSLNGMQLSLTQQLQTGQVVKIDSAVCQTLARIAYCRAAGSEHWQVGVEFVTLRFANVRGSFVSAEV